MHPSGKICLVQKSCRWHFFFFGGVRGVEGLLLHRQPLARVRQILHAHSVTTTHAASTCVACAFLPPTQTALATWETGDGREQVLLALRYDTIRENRKGKKWNRGIHWLGENEGKRSRPLAEHSPQCVPSGRWQRPARQPAASSMADRVWPGLDVGVLGRSVPPPCLAEHREPCREETLNHGPECMGHGGAS